MILIILKFLIFLLVFSLVLTNLIFINRNRKYQKKWVESKDKLIKLDPKITRAELCEQYVMFCLRNDCKVEF